MLTLIIIIAIAAVATFILMKKGKIADANNNNIPDALEVKVEEIKEVVADVKEEVKEVVEKVKKATPKKPAAKQSAKKNK